MIMKTKLLILMMYLLTLLYGGSQLSAQVTVGANEKPMDGAIFQLKTIDDTDSNGGINATKGIGFPRVELSSNTNLYPMFLTNSADPTSGPNTDYSTRKADIDKTHRGLVVYNVGNKFAQGLYYWDGTEWMSLDNTRAIAPEVAEILCGAASLSPGAYYQGEPYVGVMRVPYAGGNGGIYSSGAAFTSNGLTFRLQAGKLEIGAGELVFNVQGTNPTVSSPVVTRVPINSTTVPFFTGSCEAVVGDQITADIKNIAVMDYMRFVQNDPQTNLAGYYVQCHTPDGLYTIRVWFEHSRQNGSATATNNTTSARIDGATNNVQIRNNTTGNVTIMWNYNTEWGSYLGSAGGGLVIPAGVFGGGVGNTWTTGGPWANRGIYNASNSGPEHRRYTWIDTSNTKVAYTATVMAGIDPNEDVRQITKQKVFIKIEQITAQ